MADRNWKLETWRYEPRTWMLHDEGYATRIDGPDRHGDLCVELDEHGYGTMRSYVPVVQVASLLRAMGWSVSAPRAPSPPETPASEGTMGDRDRLRDGIEAAARVLAANGIDARSHLDLRPDARREITEILASASPASAPPYPDSGDSETP